MPKLSISPAARKDALACGDQSLQLVRSHGCARLWKSRSAPATNFHITKGAQPMLARIQSLDTALACFKTITNGITHV